ncbi:hypothetical protein PV326_009238 [Microctonus aethiopoides]|nr:hypothetical protein PV326_009238 [Microctonus aethiopoides]
MTCEKLKSNSDDEFTAYYATCYGKIGTCSQLQSTICSGKIKYCLSPNANKHYTWASDIDETYRARGKCKNPIYQTGGSCAESAYKCNHCMCICTEDNNLNSNAVRSFSLRLQESDINQNMIVTGLKIVKINTMIHLQIQQAKLLPNNKIDPNTKFWKPLDEIVKLTNHSLFPNDWTKLSADEDYLSLSFANRTINLDDIILPLDYVVTGVRFGRTLSEDQQTSALRIEVKGVHVDREIGKIIPNTEINLTSDNMESNRLLPDYQRLRTQITLDNCDDPVEAKNYTQILETNKYIKFTHTDKKKDLAQTTIPYLDAREFTVEDDVPLIGVGLTYAGQEGYGGFITFNLYPSYIKNETSFITKQNVNLKTCQQSPNIPDDSTETLDEDSSIRNDDEMIDSLISEFLEGV